MSKCVSHNNNNGESHVQNILRNLKNWFIRLFKRFSFSIVYISLFGIFIYLMHVGLNYIYIYIYSDNWNKVKL